MDKQTTTTTTIKLKNLWDVRMFHWNCHNGKNSFNLMPFPVSSSWKVLSIILFDQHFIIVNSERKQFVFGYFSLLNISNFVLYVHVKHWLFYRKKVVRWECRSLLLEKQKHFRKINQATIFSKNKFFKNPIYKLRTSQGLAKQNANVKCEKWKSFSLFELIHHVHILTYGKCIFFPKIETRQVF